MAARARNRGHLNAPARAHLRWAPPLAPLVLPTGFHATAYPRAEHRSQAFWARVCASHHGSSTPAWRRVHSVGIGAGLRGKEPDLKPVEGPSPIHVFLLESDPLGESVGHQVTVEVEFRWRE